MSNAYRRTLPADPAASGWLDLHVGDEIVDGDRLVQIADVDYVDGLSRIRLFAYERVPGVDAWQQVAIVTVNHSPKSTSSSFWRAVHEALEREHLDYVARREVYDREMTEKDLAHKKQVEELTEYSRLHSSADETDEPYHDVG